jgi:hypothetical protein
MHKCTYRSNTITRIRKRRHSPHGGQNEVTLRGGWGERREQPVTIRHEELSTTEKNIEKTIGEGGRDPAEGGAEYGAMSQRSTYKMRTAVVWRLK